MKLENSILLGSVDDDIKNGVLVIPKGVEDIESSLFDKIESRKLLEDLWLPSTAKYLSRLCFSRCENLKNVLFYDKLQDIKDYYDGKTEIDYLETYNNLEKIERSVFSYTKINEFRVTGRLQELGNSCFYKSGLKKLSFASDTKLKLFNTSTVDYCDKLTELSMPASIEKFEIFLGEWCKNIKSVKFEKLPTFAKIGMMFIPVDGREMNSLIDCEELKPFGDLYLKDIVRIDKSFNDIAVTKKDKDKIKTFVKDGDTINNYNVTEDLFYFLREPIENFVARGELLKFYEFEKLIKNLDYRRKIPADIIPLFNSRNEIELYLKGCEKNKIFRKSENQCVAFCKVNDTSRNFVKGLTALTFMLGGFSDNQVLNQKASDFISSVVLKCNSPFAINELLNFDKTPLFMNNDEKYLNFWKNNYKELTNISTDGSMWDDYEKGKFYEYLNNNFARLTDLCHNSKEIMSVDTLLNIYNNEELLSFDKEKADISNELKKYPRTTRKTIDFVYRIKKEMQRDKISQNIFEKTDEKNIDLLFDEAKLVDKLTGKTKDDFKYDWINKYRTKNMTYSIDDRTGCANIFNLGIGIVACGMKLNNCQNLRIFDNEGKGIARATIILDKEKGTLLYNTFLVYGHTQMDRKTKLKIFDAFKLATINFIKEYEHNFPDRPKINQVNVGKTYNGLSEILDDFYDRPHQDIEGLNFSLYGDRKDDVLYNGDWEQGQYMIFNSQELSAIRKLNAELMAEKEN